MKRFFLDRAISLIRKNNENISDIEIEKIRYGLEGIYLTITKFMILAAITFYIGIFKEFMIFTVLYNFIRVFAFGMHASKSFICLISSAALFISLPLLALTINIHIILKMVLCFVSLMMIILYAPADTIKRPLLRMKKRLKLKVFSLAVTIIYIGITLISKDIFISNAVLLALIMEVILILPVTYKIFGMPYRNYKSYRHKSN